MDEKLNDIFSNINDWLKYAEAKTATLIAGNAALIFGISKIILSNDVDSNLEKYLIFCCLLCLLSLSLCLLSVIPALSMPWDSKPSDRSKKDSVIYFGDIAKYSPLTYLSLIVKKTNSKNEGFTEYQKDLAFQIIVNSVIAVKKYNYFKVAIWFTLSAIVTPLITLLVFILRSK